MSPTPYAAAAPLSRAEIAALALMALALLLIIKLHLLPALLTGLLVYELVHLLARSEEPRLNSSHT